MHVPAITADTITCVQRLPQHICTPGLIYACGHYRNGALLAPLTAALVVRLVAGDATDEALQTLAPSRAGRL